LPVGPWELAIILLIVIIIFGVGKLPQIGGALGQGIREFRTSATAADTDGDTNASTTTTPSTTETERQNNDRVTVVKENEES
jgi:sec-independent protein translocase protein TatA